MTWSESKIINMGEKICNCVIKLQSNASLSQVLAEFPKPRRAAEFPRTWLVQSEIRSYALCSLQILNQDVTWQDWEPVITFYTQQIFKNDQF